MSAISLHTRSSRKSQCTFSFAAAAPQYFSVPPCRTFEVFREGPEADRPPLAVQISPPRGSVGGLAPGWAEGDSKASSRFEGTGNRIQVSGTAGKNSATEPPLHCPEKKAVVWPQVCCGELKSIQPGFGRRSHGGTMNLL
ncbi:uncharacterized protein LOC143688686 isoform X2 [Tamandua tetradactyla]|uniref:uncharacterized protein LOC143688686 isoform X2 n=1 Tax=Tamandua tetradactyla TaxID=48850 RepID=UPI0040543C43